MITNPIHYFPSSRRSTSFITLVLSLTLTILLSACQWKQKGDEGQAGHDHTAIVVKEGPVAVLEKQVLATHDSIMPTMSELMKLKKAVAEKKATQPSGRMKEQGMTVSRSLTEADERMMNWMNEYNGDTLSKLDEAKALSYLRGQQVRVLQVRDKMRRSIADARAYLGQQP